ncbi:hypothetical protein AN958_06165 [Leucoagaricus sp. SymC.cos]|nr:hypothetical protein AN958_06165 [Leucoagaricus sp. SymC.cos]
MTRSALPQYIKQFGGTPIDSTPTYIVLMSLSTNIPATVPSEFRSDHVDVFKDKSLEFFKKLTQDHYIDMPHADKVASKARILFAELLSTFCTVRAAARSSKIMIQDTLTIEIKIADDPTVTQAKTKQIISKYRKAARYLQAGSCFEIMDAKLTNFMITIVEKELDELTCEIVNGERKRGQCDNNKDIVEIIDPPHVGGEMSSLVNLLVGPLFKLARYKTSKAYQQRSEGSYHNPSAYEKLTYYVEMQAIIKNMRADKTVVEGISKGTQGARIIINECKGAWIEIHGQIYGSSTSARLNAMLPMKTVTLAEKEEVTRLLKDTQSSLDGLDIHMNTVVKEINDCYGHTMSQVVKAFFQAIQDLFKTLTQLTTAVDLIPEHHKDTLLGYIHALARCFLKQLRSIADILTEWTSHLGTCSKSITPQLSNGFISKITEITLETEDFGQNFAVSRERITVLVTKEIVDKKVRAAQNKRNDIKTHGSELGSYLPLATLDQFTGALDKVKVAFSKTLQLSLELGIGYFHYSSQPGVTPMSLDDDEVDFNKFPVNPFLVDSQTLTEASNALGQQIIGLARLAGEKNTAEVEIVTSTS